MTSLVDHKPTAQARWASVNRPIVNERERRRAAMYASAVAIWKLERGCADCGYDTDPAALDFDHLEGKVEAVSRMMNQSIVRIIDEMEKCEVVCANCHRLRTVQRRRALLQA